MPVDADTNVARVPKVVRFIEFADAMLGRHDIPKPKTDLLRPHDESGRLRTKFVAFLPAQENNALSNRVAYLHISPQRRRGKARDRLNPTRVVGAHLRSPFVRPH